MRVVVVGVVMASLGACGEIERNPAQESGSGGMAAMGGEEPSNEGGGAAPQRTFSAPRHCASAAECEGHPCIELSPGGYSLCVIAPEERKECTSDMDRCCSTADCAEGRCVGSPLTHVCGPVERYSACATDECHGDSCGAGMICAPPGVMGAVAMCMRAACVRDADCTAAPGGTCALVEGCCRNPLGLLCAYSGTGCVQDRDCTVDKYCGLAPNGTDTACVDKPRRCPQGVSGAGAF